MRRRDFLKASGMGLAAPFGLPAAFGLEFGLRETAETSLRASASGFVHPGIYQTEQDLAFMKEKVHAKEEPWSSTWARILQEPESSLSFSPAAVAHVVRGAFGHGAVGDKELQASVKAAENHMLRWVIDSDHAHADKAMDILDSWSKTLWDFDGNDAKLLAGWTGTSLCNTAEILRSTYPGWSSKVDQSFRGLLNGVYVPLLREFFPTANGNWDGAIMQTLAAIGIYCDDRSRFDAATQHFLYGVANAGITKYVYPSGQCEETDRDQGHTQLGLGYFSRMALVAWNQNVDLFSAAGDRLALGFEYTAKYLLGGDVPYFGDISTRGRGKCEDYYEAAYEHYRFVSGMSMPYTEQAVEKARDAGAQTTLIFYRGQSAGKQKPELPAPVVAAGMPSAGAQLSNAQTPHSGATVISPGTEIQPSLDALAAKGGGELFLEAGLHIVPSPLRLPSGVTLSGQGRSTMLSLTPNASGYCIVEDDTSLHDIVLSDFLLDGGVSYTPPTDPNEEKRQESSYLVAARGGIRLQGNKAGAFANIRLEHLTVRNCTMAGVAIAGASNVVIQSCDLSNNGGYVAPGPGQHHNLQMIYVSGVQVDDSRLDGSIAGCGLHIRSGSRVSVTGTEAARNPQAGMRFVDCTRVSVEHSLVEGNDQQGIDLAPQGAEKQSAVPVENRVQLNGSDLLRQCGAKPAPARWKG
jgi:Right handed beta helix region/Alginate lyase